MFPFSWVGADLKAERQARAAERAEAREERIARAQEQIAANGKQEAERR